MAEYLDKAGLTYLWAKIKTNINNHTNNKSNPHEVTKAQIGLGSVDNVSTASILQSIYPVGSIYMSVSATSPASLFGGAWEQLKDRFLLGAGDQFVAGFVGGEISHALTVTEMPKDIGTFNALGWGTNATGAFSFHHDRIDRTAPVGEEFGDTAYTLSGGGNPHNNMPPYRIVYMWKRTA